MFRSLSGLSITGVRTIMEGDLYTCEQTGKRGSKSMDNTWKKVRWRLTQHLCSSHPFQIAARETRQRCPLYPLIGREEGCTAVIITTRLLDDRDSISKRQSVCLLFKITECIG